MGRKKISIFKGNGNVMLLICRISWSNMKSFGDQDSSVFIPVGALISKEGSEEEIKEDDQANKRAELLPVAVAAAPPAESTTQFPDDVAKMVGYIKERVEAGQREKPTIYQVPRVLRQGNEKWYEPQLISIGPYHRDKEHLQPMEEQKIQRLREILSRNKKVKLEDYMKEFVKLEQAAKNCYSSQSVSQIPRDEFVKMMLLDGCFLVEIFLQNNVEEDAPAPDIYNEIWLPAFIYHDMLLLENQLPYFVLNCIYKQVVKGQEDVVAMADLALRCFKFVPVLPLNKAETSRKYHHLVHLFHHHCLPKNDYDDGHRGADSSIVRKFMKHSAISLFFSGPEMHLDQQLPLHAAVAPYPTAQAMNSNTNNASTPKQGDFKVKIRNFARCVLLLELILGATSCFPSSPEGKKSLSVPSAEELDEAGIKFELPKQKPGDSFLSIQFRKEDGVLEIPYLFFSDDLHSVIQNFVAFEQCSYSDDDAFFVRYVLLMDCLISSGKDVKILRRSKVLEHGLGNDGELADVFNRMSAGVFWESSDTPLSQLYQGINDYCGRKRYRFRAYSRRSRAYCYRSRAYCEDNYCYSPCTTISLLAAIFLLLLTATQTYFAVFPRA